jgi:formylglycine-generating enzyme required for sulfatase activity/tRNA A-37 threonylcarbamoyl transferase component Bud32
VDHMTLTLSSPYEFDDARLPSVPTNVGRYQIGSVLGTGAMGVVYRAHDPYLGRAVAIKLVRDTRANTSGQARLLREAQAMARLRHPNVVPIFDVGEVDGAMFVAMPILEGGTLKRWLCDGSRSLDAILDRFIAAGRGLAAAHAAGLVHRDFKPDNVLLGTDGEIHVADFGLARLANDHLASNAGTDPLVPGLLTQKGAVVGTPPYMAPEQLRNHPIDARADQFSFCVALWEAIFGRRPFPDPSTGIEHPIRARLDTIAAGPPLRRDHTAIARILARGLAFDPDNRWPSMQALLEKITTHRGHRYWRPLAGSLGAIGLATAIVAFAWPQGLEPIRMFSWGSVRETAVPDGQRKVSPAVSASRGNCPSGTVRVPSGRFQMGSPEGVGLADEHPMHEVTLSAYCIDKTEVTVEAYVACATAKGCPPPQFSELSYDLGPNDLRRRSQFCNSTDRPDHPINCVDWNQAVAYCQWAGERLPTEAEWEYAARGSDGRTYPWGVDAPSPERLNVYGTADGYDSTSPVGSFPYSASPFGALDMAGNVWEWTADWYGFYSEEPVSDPQGPMDGTRHVLRGAGWMNHDPGVARAAFRNWGEPMVRVNTLGFRCVHAG